MNYEVIYRSATVYIFMVIAIRLAGKKELSQLSTTDLVFIILISNAVQNAMVGDNTTLIGGIIAASTLFILNYILKYAMFESKWFRRLVESDPLPLVIDGEVNDKNLFHAKLTFDELLEAIREHGISDVKKVKLCILEVDGNISVVSNDDGFKRTYHKRKKVPRKLMGN